MPLAPISQKLFGVYLSNLALTYILALPLCMTNCELTLFYLPTCLFLGLAHLLWPLVPAVHWWFTLCDL